MATIIASETVYKGWTHVRRLRLRLADGQEVSREVEDHGSAVAVLPYDLARGVVMLVRVLRAPVLMSGGPPDMLEAPAGLIEDGDANETALREAMEETGLRLARLEPQGWAYASPGLSSERIHLYLSTYTQADRIAAGGGVASEQEYIEVVETPIRTAQSMLEDGRIVDLKTLTLLLLLRARHPEAFETGGGP